MHVLRASDKCLDVVGNLTPPQCALDRVRLSRAGLANLLLAHCRREHLVRHRFLSALLYRSQKSHGEKCWNN
jgi:hypothetical protein